MSKPVAQSQVREEEQKAQNALDSRRMQVYSVFYERKLRQLYPDKPDAFYRMVAQRYAKQQLGQEPIPGAQTAPYDVPGYHSVKSNYASPLALNPELAESLPLGELAKQALSRQLVTTDDSVSPMGILARKTPYGDVAETRLGQGLRDLAGVTRPVTRGFNDAVNTFSYRMLPNAVSAALPGELPTEEQVAKTKAEAAKKGVPYQETWRDRLAIPAEDYDTLSATPKKGMGASQRIDTGHPVEDYVRNVLYDIGTGHTLVEDWTDKPAWEELKQAGGAKNKAAGYAMQGLGIVPSMTADMAAFEALPGLPIRGAAQLVRAGLARASLARLQNLARSEGLGEKLIVDAGNSADKLREALVAHLMEAPPEQLQGRLGRLALALEDTKHLKDAKPLTEVEKLPVKTASVEEGEEPLDFHHWYTWFSDELGPLTRDSENPEIRPISLKDREAMREMGVPRFDVPADMEDVPLSVYDHVTPEAEVASEVPADYLPQARPPIDVPETKSFTHSTPEEVAAAREELSNLVRTVPPEMVRNVINEHVARTMNPKLIPLVDDVHVPPGWIQEHSAALSELAKKVKPGAPMRQAVKDYALEHGGYVPTRPEQRGVVNEMKRAIYLLQTRTQYVPPAGSWQADTIAREYNMHVEGLHRRLTQEVVRRGKSMFTQMVNHLPESPVEALTRVVHVSEPEAERLLLSTVNEIPERLDLPLLDSVVKVMVRQHQLPPGTTTEAVLLDYRYSQLQRQLYSHIVAKHLDSPELKRLGVFDFRDFDINAIVSVRGAESSSIQLATAWKRFTEDPVYADKVRTELVKTALLGEETSDLLVNRLAVKYGPAIRTWALTTGVRTPMDIAEVTEVLFQNGMAFVDHVDLPVFNAVSKAVREEAAAHVGDMQTAEGTVNNVLEQITPVFQDNVRKVYARGSIVQDLVHSTQWLHMQSVVNAVNALYRQGVLAGYMLPNLRYLTENAVTAPLILAATSPGRVADILGMTLKVLGKDRVPGVSKAARLTDAMLQKIPALTDRWRSLFLQGERAWQSKLYTFDEAMALADKLNIGMTPSQFAMSDKTRGLSTSAKRTMQWLLTDSEPVPYADQAWKRLTQLVSKATGRRVNNLRLWLDPRKSTLWTRVADETDMLYRRGAFLAGLHEGMSPEQAAAFARNAMLDYGAVPGANLARRTMAFVTFRMAMMKAMMLMLFHPDGARTIHELAVLHNHWMDQVYKSGYLADSRVGESLFVGSNHEGGGVNLSYNDPVISALNGTLSLVDVGLAVKNGSLTASELSDLFAQEGFTTPALAAIVDALSAGNTAKVPKTQTYLTQVESRGTGLPALVGRMGTPLSSSKNYAPAPDWRTNPSLPTYDVPTKAGYTGVQYQFNKDQYNMYLLARTAWTYSGLARLRNDMAQLMLLTTTTPGIDPGMYGDLRQRYGNVATALAHQLGKYSPGSVNTPEQAIERSKRNYLRQQQSQKTTPTLQEE